MLYVWLLFVVCYCVSPEPPLTPGPPAPTHTSTLSPSDRLAQCQDRMFVFELCQHIKRGRSSTRGRTNKLAPSSKVRGNMTSMDISDWLSRAVWDNGMDRSNWILWITENPFSCTEKCALSRSQSMEILLSSVSAGLNLSIKNNIWFILLPLWLGQGLLNTFPDFDHFVHNILCETKNTFTLTLGHCCHFGDIAQHILSFHCWVHLFPVNYKSGFKHIQSRFSFCL